MTPQPPARPSDASDSRTGSRDLDARIRQIEQRIVARREHLFAEAREASDRVQHALRPRRILPPLLATTLAAAALWSLLRRDRRDSGSGPAVADSRAHSAQPPNGWMRLVDIGWPLVSARFGTGSSPTLAAAILSAGLPLARRLLAGSPDARRAAETPRRQASPLP